MNKVLHAVVLSKESLQPQATQNQKTNKYSQVAVNRSKNKKTSFKMMLQREAQNQTVNIKAEDNDVPVIVTIAQDENPELRQMLNCFYEEESYKKSERNVGLLDEIIKVADFLTPDNKIVLRKMMDEVFFYYLLSYF